MAPYSLDGHQVENQVKTYDMTVLKIIGVIILVLSVGGFAVLQFGDVARMINKTRDARATDKKKRDDNKLAARP